MIRENRIQSTGRPGQTRSKGLVRLAGQSRDMRWSLSSRSIGQRTFAVIIHVPPTRPSETLSEAVRRGLATDRKSIPCRFFYDEEGSRLFEAICELPEYYLTRTEDAILERNAREMIAGCSTPPVLVELGSGSSTKTRRLIQAAMDEYGALHYVPIDVSSAILHESADRLVRDFPGLRVTAYSADYRDALGRVGAFSQAPKVIAFLGSSLGNYDTADAVHLLSEIAGIMRPEDRLLLGTDLVKSTARLEAAYNDSQGITARFNLNLLARINRELHADFDLESFEHMAHFRGDRMRIEMNLVSLRDQVVRIRKAGITVRFAAGERIHTENSHKYDTRLLSELAHLAGLEESASWTDPEALFRVQSWRRRTKG